MQTLFLIQTRLKEFLDKKSFGYDIVLIDCPPTLSTLLLSPLIAANGLLIPTYADDVATHGMNQLMGKIESIQKVNKNLKVYGIALVAIEAGTKEVGKIKFLLNHKYGDLVMKSTTRRSVKYKETGKPKNVDKDITQIAGKTTTLAKDFTALAEEALRRFGIKKTKRIIKKSTKNMIKSKNKPKRNVSGVA